MVSFSKNGKRMGRPPGHRGLLDRESDKIKINKEDKMAVVAAYEPRDALDQEINKAVMTNQPLDLAKAFPDAPIPVLPTRPRKGDPLTLYPTMTDNAHGLTTQAERTRYRVAEGEQQAQLEDNSPGNDTFQGEPGERSEGIVVTTLPRADDDPAARIERIKKLSPVYVMEYRLKVVFRMLMRDIPLDIIAQSLKVSIDSVLHYRTLLKKRLREEARNFDTTTYLGESMAFYKEVKSLCIRMATDNEAKANHRLEAFRTALMAHQQQSQLLHVFGVPDKVPYDSRLAAGPLDGADPNSNKLIDMVKAVMAGDSTVDAIYEVEDANVSEDETTTGLT